LLNDIGVTRLIDLKRFVAIGTFNFVHGITLE